jgi:DNA-binding transcriptional LysR family regulator
VVVDDNPVDIVAAGCDAGVRYGELLSNDMTAVPIGPARQRLVTAASPDYIRTRGTPLHPRDLLNHACLRHRFPGGASPPWVFEREGEAVRVDPAGRLIVSTISPDLELHAALAGHGIVYLFEDWLAGHVHSGALVVILDAWCQPFEGPRLYFSKRPVIPRPLRLFLDHIRRQANVQAATA